MLLESIEQRGSKAEIALHEVFRVLRSVHSGKIEHEIAGRTIYDLANKPDFTAVTADTAEAESADGAENEAAEKPVTPEEEWNAGVEKAGARTNWQTNGAFARPVA